MINAMVGWCCPMPIFIVGEYTNSNVVLAYELCS